jgi:putative membrane protein
MYGQGMGFSNWLCGGTGFMSGPIGMIVMILFWAVIIGVAVKLFLVLFSSKAQRNDSSALAILKERYAAGEISKLEFEQMKKDIS